MVVFFGISWGVLGVILLIALLGGAFALEQAITFLLGPVKWIAIILFILSAIGYICTSFFPSEENSHAKLIARLLGCILNSISNFIRNGINVVFLLCPLIGFLQNMKNNHILWGIFTILGDGLVTLLLLVFSGLIDYCILNYSSEHSGDYSMILVGSIHLIVSLVYLLIIQYLLSRFYASTVNLLFSETPEITQFILTPWTSMLFH